MGSKTNIVPEDFDNFGENMDSWGHELQNTNTTICEMAAESFGLERDAFSKHIKNGSNYISPPGVDLAKSKQGEVITGFHRDFGLMTAHAPTRFEGFSAWLLTG